MIGLSLPVCVCWGGGGGGGMICGVAKRNRLLGCAEQAGAACSFGEGVVLGYLNLFDTRLVNAWCVSPPR